LRSIRTDQHDEVAQLSEFHAIDGIADTGDRRRLSLFGYKSWTHNDRTG